MAEATKTLTNELKIHAPAKINLWLEIKRRRPDGYHDIESVMQTVSLMDTLTMAKDDAIRLTCSEPLLDCGESNLCTRAARLFFETAGIKGGVRMHVEKRIPIAGGLAGGSTDAAAVLRGLNQLYDTGYTEEQLCEIGVKIGADVPFCLKQGIVVTRGIGERFSPCPKLPDCFFVIACDGEGISTPWAYGRLDEMFDFESRGADANTFVRVAERGSLAEIAASMTNIFEAAVLPIRPRALQIKEILSEGGALRALMSGSGPSVFGVFHRKRDAENSIRCLDALGITAHLCTPYYPEKI